MHRIQRFEKHYVNRVGWIRAAVLGANDGILSTSSVAVGVVAANGPLVLSTLAALVAGALSMAAGEYVSVSSQEDIEKSDIQREKMELLEMPDEELEELAKIYEKRGLDKELAMKVAVQLSEKDALGAHTRDELGINEVTLANPLQAAAASMGSFTLGGILPFLVAFLAPEAEMIFYQYGFAIVFLALLGAVAARTGGTHIGKSVLRIVVWGTIAMAVSVLVGRLFGINMA